MGLILARTCVIRSEVKSKKTNHERQSFPPDFMKADRYFSSLSIQQIEKMSSKEMRTYLRTQARLATKDKQGNPYAYRLLWAGGKNGIRTLFPATKRGEKIAIHGRLDHDERLKLELQRQASNRQ
jgi:hypothetical protein